MSKKPLTEAELRERAAAHPLGQSHSPDQWARLLGLQDPATGTRKVGRPPITEAEFHARVRAATNELAELKPGMTPTVGQFAKHLNVNKRWFERLIQRFGWPS